MKVGDTVIDNVINDLEIAKRLLASPFPLDMSMRIKVGQAITKAVELLEIDKIDEDKDGLKEEDL